MGARVGDVALTVSPKVPVSARAPWANRSEFTITLLEDLIHD